jgi:hypothetical protein
MSGVERLVVSSWRELTRAARLDEKTLNSCKISVDMAEIAAIMRLAWGMMSLEGDNLGTKMERR